MSQQIKLTPAELKAQSAEMTALNQEMDALFSKINAEMESANVNWSAALSNNFASKLKSVNSSFKELSDLFAVGANAAMSSAESMETVDAELSKIMYGGDGSFGGGAGGGGFRDSGADGGEKSFWGTAWDELKKDWGYAGESIEWLEEQFDKLPDWLQKDLKKVGGDLTPAIEITADLITGDLSFDTLGTYLDAIGVDSLKGGAIVQTFKSVFTNNTIQQLYDDGAYLQDLAIDELLDGQIGDGLLHLGESFLTQFACIPVGVGDVLTEMAGGAVSSILDKGSAVIDAIGNIIPGGVGDGIIDIGEAISSGASAIGDFFSNLI